MAKIKPMPLIDSMSQKVCMHSDVYFRTNKQTGVTYSGKICNPSEKEPSAAQIKAQERFTKVQAAIRLILTDPTEKAKLKAEFKSQDKIGSLFGYAMHKLNGNYDANGDLINEGD